MRPRKAPDVERPGHRREDLLDLLGEDGAQTALVQLLELAGGNAIADALRRLWTEVGGDQRFLDIVESGGVERLLLDDAGDVVGNLVGGFLEAGRQPVEPAHANTPTRLS